MNTNWKEEFKEKFKHSQFVNYSAIKAFIQDQITKAYNEGYGDGFDRAREIALEAITYKPKTN